MDFSSYDFAPAYTVEPPISGSPIEMRRQKHTRLRVRLMSGQHARDVKGRTDVAVGPQRAEAWGEPDTSSNALQAGARALATLYDPDLDESDAFPTATNAGDDTVGPAMDEVLAQGGIWPLMSNVQAMTLGLREMLVRIDVDGTDDQGRPQLSYRPVTPDLVEAKPDKRNPSRPVEVRELRWRCDPVTGDEGWTREVWSIDKGVGRHQVLDPSGNDVSDCWGLPKGGLNGDAYPVRASDGTPRLPYVIYHAELTGALWDPYRWVEIVNGTLTCCVWWTFVGHVMFNAAFALRYASNLQPAGARVVDAKTAAQRRAAVADPAVMQQLDVVDPDADTLIGQLGPAADPEALARTCIAYERRLHAMIGLDPADAQRISGDPRSGYALAISRASKEVHALRYAPTFARTDAELVAISAILYNRAAGFLMFPESGWSVLHAPIRAIRRRAAAAAAAPETVRVTAAADPAAT